MKPLARFQTLIQHGASILQIIAGFVIFLSAVGVTLNAIARYGLGRDIALITEMGGFIFLFVVFFGLAAAFAAGSHVTVEILSVIASKKVARFMYRIFVPIISMIFVGTLLVTGFIMTQRFYGSGRLTIGNNPMPFWIFMAIVPVGCVAMEFSLLSYLIDGLKKKDPQEDDQPNQA